MNGKLKIGLVGSGSMGSHLITQAAKIEDVSVTAVSDILEERASALAATLGCAHFNSLEAMLDGADLDAVIVATPGYLHSEMAVTIASRGKHVFSEKPMAMSIDQAQAMIEAAKRSSVILAVGQVLKLFPMGLAIRNLLDSGKLGTPISASFDRMAFGGESWASMWRHSRKMSGGLLAEVNVHELDFIKHLLGGEPKAVSATAGNYFADVEYEDYAVVNMIFANGAVGSLRASLSSTIGGYNGRVDCSNGSLTFTDFFGDSQITWKTRSGESGVVKLSDYKTTEPYLQELIYFVDAVLGRSPLPYGFRGEDGLKTIEIAQAAHLSAFRGCQVALPLSPGEPGLDVKP